MHEAPPPALRVARPESEVARAVYADIVRFGPRPRTELAARLGLSGPTLTRVTRTLLDDGLLRELPPRPALKGRPQEPLDVDEDHARFLGVKISADRVHAAVTTVRGVVLEDLSAPTSPDPASVLKTVGVLARPLVRAHPRVACAGVSLSAVVHDGGRAVRSELLGWDEPVDLAAPLSARLRVPVVVDNDFTALLEGIAWSDLGRRYPSFTVLTIGAGAAIGVVLDQRVVRGARHLAGTTEAMPVSLGARGGRTIRLGEAVRTRDVCERARRRGVIGPRDGMGSLLAAAGRGEPEAVAIADEVAEASAIAAAATIAVVDPAALLVGGEGSALLEAGSGAFDDRVRELLPPAQRELVVRHLPADFDAWARGAAVIAVRAFIGVA